MLPTLIIGLATLSACDESSADTGYYYSTYDEPYVPVERVSIAPSTTNGRPNNYLGCVEITSRSQTIQAWDHQTVDGDVISLIANDKVIADAVTLGGPGAEYSTSFTFDNNGFNYLTLYAHNEGDLPPNTAAISLGAEEFVLEANLEANGYVDVVVLGYGVTCDGPTGTNGYGTYGTNGGTNGGTNATTGTATFWTAIDHGCGFIDVNVAGLGSQTMSAYHSFAECGLDGAANYYDVEPGTYDYTATCTGLSWTGSITVNAGGCSTMELLP